MNHDQTIESALIALNRVISKSRVHFYKPIQVAEILYRDRVHQDIDLNDLESYRIKSKSWRDDISRILVGRCSTSSAKFQDNLFEENALPPSLIRLLGIRNKQTSGGVEKHIYAKFEEKYSDLSSALDYAITRRDNFSLDQFLELFKRQLGLRRSLDKVYEIVVYALFTSLIDALGVEISVDIKDKDSFLLFEFSEFANKILGESFSHTQQKYPAKLFRVGVTNAADRGLDMWGNFGLAIQIKHLTISTEVAEDIAESISADRIVIVCKDAEEELIYSVLSQIGWRSRIQAIITFSELTSWYDKAIKGKYSNILCDKVLSNLAEQIELEFPSIARNDRFHNFLLKRGYR
ncbi:MAG: HaeII family restriction endonuclease [Aestuariivita sp.]|nr:HaeII family restriction endonuclease [Aestuariivita sp.]